MSRRYDSFVLRFWRLADERRVEVEHLQSGGRMRGASLPEAVDWIGAQCGDAGVKAPDARFRLAAIVEEVMPSEPQSIDAHTD